jgi:hypothetical protein
LLLLSDSTILLLLSDSTILLLLLDATIDLIAAVLAVDDMTLQSILSLLSIGLSLAVN